MKLIGKTIKKVVHEDEKFTFHFTDGSEWFIKADWAFEDYTNVDDEERVEKYCCVDCHEGFYEEDLIEMPNDEAYCPTCIDSLIDQGIVCKNEKGEMSFV